MIDEMIFNHPYEGLTVSRTYYESAFISLYIYMQVTSILPVVSGSLIVTPQNIAVISGQEVEMQCQTDGGKELKWYRQRPGSHNEEPIHNGYGFTSHAAGFYRMTNSSDGKYTLRFNASVETAQRYSCLEPGSLDAKSAEMILLESDPSCDVTRDDAFINITCGIGFHGNWAPVMEWTRCNNETIITSDVSESIVQNYRSSLTIRQIDNDSASCYRLTTMFREAGRPLETSADNIPTYNHTICFKQPDWGNTSECSEARKNESNTFNSMDIETQNSLLVSITVISISTIIVTIAVICVTRSCYKRKQRNVTNPDATEIVMLKGGKDYNNHRSNKTEESTKQENRRLNRTVLSSV